MGKLCCWFRCAPPSVGNPLTKSCRNKSQTNIYHHFSIVVCTLVLIGSCCTHHSPSLYLVVLLFILFKIQCSNWEQFPSSSHYCMSHARSCLSEFRGQLSSQLRTPFTMGNTLEGLHSSSMPLATAPTLATWFLTVPSIG